MNNVLTERRRHALGPACKHFYERPLYLVRGEDVWLYDDRGNRYLDCYNNVPSVGHCHPEVVATLTKQAATLNTHTRYLHHAIVEYAEMLAATLPGDLSVCSFVCTGTEANDLAYRIARAVTGNRGAIVTEGAYHGNSTLVTELSREAGCSRPGPEFIAAVEPPYTYRGTYGEDQPDYADAYANLVDDAIEGLAENGHKPAMIIIDSIFDARGILTPPPEYQQKVYEKVRAAGGLVVADEVQSGLARLGDHMWGFMDSGVVPDIVTMGKPMGDGHPLAIVVTTPDIAARFAQETHYFNTFGGNPVSAEVGRKVLDIVLRDNLLANARETGDYLVGGLNELAGMRELIGEIRGKGLFIGVELVTSREAKTPATEEAIAAAEAMREAGVLLSCIGQHRNVLKIRPPLTFRREHADIVLEKLDATLTQLG
ncbi:MAG: aminotransferase class III-fold pyridoxal phosphate-dependent enzyme [Gammaproteobacteria bacterium]|nr:aminotransferase class III-fold pyridoxal phosphate-dependent enzyme [Gammaproteobacteria bacterium]